MTSGNNTNAGRVFYRVLDISLEIILSTIVQARTEVQKEFCRICCHFGS